MVHVRITTAIVKDVQAHQAKVAAEGYAAEQEDLEAERILNEAAKDGFSNADLPAVAEAIRHIRRSAARDRAISEAHA